MATSASEPTPTTAPAPPSSTFADAPPWIAKPPRAHVVEILAQVPHASRFVAGLDVPRLARGALASRYTGMLAMMLPHLPASCSAVSLADFDRVVAAGVGTKGEHVVFLGPTLEERKTAECFAAATLKKNHVTIEQRPVFGTTAYVATGPAAKDEALAWTKRSGPIVVDRSAWLVATLDPKSPKASPELVELASTADHTRTFWFAAQVSESDVAGLGLPPGTLTGPFTVRLGIDVDGTAEVDADFVFSSAADAERAAAFLRSDQGIGQLTDARLGVHGAEVRVMLHADADAVQEFLKQMPATWTP